jgi:hypothetical protein
MSQTMSSVASNGTIDSVVPASNDKHQAGDTDTPSARDLPLQSDDWIYRAVVVTLGATILLVVIGTLVLAALPTFLRLGTSETPPALIALGSAAVGALGGLLAPSPGNHG